MRVKDKNTRAAAEPLHETFAQMGLKPGFRYST